MSHQRYNQTFIKSFSYSPHPFHSSVLFNRAMQITIIMFYNNLNIYKIDIFSLSLFDDNYQLLFCFFVGVI